MEGDAVSPTSPVPSPRADSFLNLQRTSWEQQRTRSFDSARGRAQACISAEPFSSAPHLRAQATVHYAGVVLARELRVTELRAAAMDEEILSPSADDKHP